MFALFHNRHMGAVMGGLERSNIAGGTSPNHNNLGPFPVRPNGRTRRGLDCDPGRSPLPQPSDRIFQALLQPSHEAGGQHTVDDPMIATQLDGHHLG